MVDEKTGFQDRKVTSCRSGAKSGLARQFRLVQYVGSAQSGRLHQAGEFGQMADVADPAEVAFKICAAEGLHPKDSLGFAFCREAERKPCLAAKAVAPGREAPWASSMIAPTLHCLKLILPFHGERSPCVTFLKGLEL
jgi:hypothetical protein